MFAVCLFSVFMLSDYLTSINQSINVYFFTRDSIESTSSHTGWLVGSYGALP